MPGTKALDTTTVIAVLVREQYRVDRIKLDFQAFEATRELP